VCKYQLFLVGWLFTGGFSAFLLRWGKDHQHLGICLADVTLNPTDLIVGCQKQVCCRANHLCGSASPPVPFGGVHNQGALMFLFFLLLQLGKRTTLNSSVLNLHVQALFQI